MTYQFFSDHGWVPLKTFFIGCCCWWGVGRGRGGEKLEVKFNSVQYELGCELIPTIFMIICFHSLQYISWTNTKQVTWCFEFWGIKFKQ